jgi:L-lactate dehydrogenase complex protein LldG
MSEYYIGVVKGSTIVAEYDDMFDILAGLPEMPNFVGYITGPSRTADIECVSTVGVHGPLKMSVVVVDDE